MSRLRPVRPLARRWMPLLAAIVLLGAFSSPGAAETRPGPAPDESLSVASQAAGWLASAGLHPDGAAYTGDRADPVTTAWSVLALRAAGLTQESARPSQWLEQHVDDLARENGQDSAAGLALLVLVARSENRPPENFGGQDLLARLLATRGPDGVFGSTRGPQPVADPLGGVPSRQGLVLAALSAAGQPDAAGVQWLQRLECPAGGWQFDRLDPATPCAPDPVTTGYAVQGLVASGQGISPRTIAALHRLQDPDGGFPLFPRITDSMATALGLQALIAAGEDPNTDPWRKRTGGQTATPFDALLRFDTDPAGGFSARPGRPPDVGLTSRLVLAAAGTPIPLAASDDPTPSPSTGDDVSGTATTDTGSGFSAAPLIAIVVVVAAAVGGVYLYRRRRQAL